MDKDRIDNSIVALITSKTLMCLLYLRILSIHLTNVPARK